MAQLTVYVFNRRDLRAPLAIAAVLTVYVVWRGDWVGLAGLPLIYLGWCCCAPNLNLADGCLPVLATALLGVVGVSLGQTGLIAASGACGATWLAASLESAWCSRPKAINVESPHPPEPAARPNSSDEQPSPPAR